MKIIFIGDAHLSGLDDANMAPLCSFIDSLWPINTLVIMGDLFDVWTGTNKATLREYAPLLKSLRVLKCKGTKIVYLEGNHDFSLGKFFTGDLLAEVYPEEHTMEIDGKRLYLSHGDTVHMKAGDKLWRLFLRSPLFTLLSKLLGSNNVWRIAKKLSSKSRYYGAKKDVESAIRAFAEKKLASEGYDGVIFGHSHVGGIHKEAAGSGTGFYANPGGWVNEKSYLIYEDGEFRMEIFNG